MQIIFHSNLYFNMKRKITQMSIIFEIILEIYLISNETLTHKYMLSILPNNYAKKVKSLHSKLLCMVFIAKVPDAQRNIFIAIESSKNVLSKDMAYYELMFVTAFRRIK